MTNVLKLNSSLIFAFVLSAVLLLSVAVALPAGAQQQIQEQCTLSRNITVGSVTFNSSIKVSAGTVSYKTLTSPVTADTAVKEWGTICLINTINTITDWAFFILLTISFIFIAIAGFLWMTSGGDAEKQKTAGSMIAAALVGIVIAVIARIVPAVLTGVLL